jgi:hypothetical protein
MALRVSLKYNGDIFFYADTTMFTNNY